MHSGKRRDKGKASALQKNITCCDVDHAHRIGLEGSGCGSTSAYARQGRGVAVTEADAGEAVAVEVAAAGRVAVLVAAGLWGTVAEGTTPRTHGSQRYDCGSDASPHAPW
jgi:hypothetical protein